MFQSIKYVNCIYDNKTDLYHHGYEITDSDFISNSPASSVVPSWWSTSSVASPLAALIKEYERRKYAHQEIIKNLFLLNMFLLKENWYYNMNEILQHQNTYLTSEHYLKSNFHEKYYDDLVKYTKKMMVIS